MLFNSHEFIFAFLPLVLIGWYALRRPMLRLGFLTLASWFFYAWWDWRFLPLMLSSTAIDYGAGRLLVATDDERRRRAVLVTALSLNLALLGYFKYAGFFLTSLNGLGTAFGIGIDFPMLHIVLPIGISFYTFNSMSYTIDVFRRQVNPAKSNVHYAAFVSKFPHLIAGPIVRYSTMEGQLQRLAPRLSPQLAASGLFFFACGLTKKLLVADSFAPHVDSLFARHQHLTLVSAWAAAIGYSLQLYFDFSGYSDLAVGLAFRLGFRFPQNFNSPYKSINISDFWRRWHMSLSFWMRDYLFIPLGGSQGGRWRTLRNLTITMFLGGLWHGAAWTFVVWGLLHGLFLVVHSLCRDHGLTPRSTIENRVITFVCVVGAFVIFRAPNMHVADDVLSAMAGLHGLGSPGAIRATVGIGFAASIVAALAWVNLVPNTWEIEVRPRPWLGLALGLVTAIAILQISSPSPFLYYQF